MALKKIHGEKVSYGTYMPDLIVFGFARVVYELRHAEILIQGHTEVFNRGHKLMGHRRLRCERQAARDC